jgi:hypothetical protein
MQAETFSEGHPLWSQWALFLRRRGLVNLAAWALDAAGPLTTLGAQLLYLTGPLLRPALSTGQLDSLASLLENGDESRAFAAFLREADSL